MDWTIFLAALGLVFVFEGILPFLSPKKWCHLMLQLLKLGERGLRIMGLCSMLVGLVLVVIARHV